MSFSILGKIRESEEERPEFYDDLNLTQWIEEINGQLGIYDLREYFRQMPDGREQIRFRQEVLQEIDEEIKRLQTATIGTTPQVQAFLEQHNSTLLKSGMTLEELLKRPEIMEDMKRYDAIVARESLTFAALQEAGIDKNIHLYPDSAFLLETNLAPLPEGWVPGKMLGLNISPMIVDNEKTPGITMQNYKALISHILETTDLHIALIPHVVWESNDDRKPIRQLYEAFASTGRVIELPDGSAPELKGYISRCEMFIGARTHATIAAYSSCVPTLVVGYSIKARGIAKDLFGTDEGYVLPVQALAQKEDLVNAFDWLYQNAQAQKAHLQQIMPDYCKKAKEAENLLREL